MSRRASCILVTCEHGGNRVPKRYARAFAGHERLLRSHRGWDAGALELAEELADRLGVTPLTSTTTRLLVDLNRSEGHPWLFSEVTRRLSKTERARIVRDHYQPHRARVVHAVRAAIGRGSTVIHLGVHSFVPELDGKTRDVDFGLLYDPSRNRERAFCRELSAHLRRELGDLRVRKNQPYRGVSDGLTTAMRRIFADADYAGIELELNQRLKGRHRTGPIAAAIVAYVQSISKGETVLTNRRRAAHGAATGPRRPGRADGRASQT